jgi:hypothetical protein
MIEAARATASRWLRQWALSKMGGSFLFLKIIFHSAIFALVSSLC